MARAATKTPEQKAEEATEAARERRGQLEEEGTFVSPTREEPPLFQDADLPRIAEEADSEELLQQVAKVFEDDLTDESRLALHAALSKGAIELEVKPQSGLHAKLAEVVMEVQYIQKTGVAPKAMGGYSFVQAGEIAKRLRLALATRGITMLPMAIEQVGDVLVQPTRNGGVLNIQTVKTRWMLTDSESGEWAIIESMGTGGDSGDKFSPKAQTNAMKYALQVGFLLETGDDPEAAELPEAVIDGAGPRGIEIQPSNVEGVRQGGRQSQGTAAQLDTILRNAREANLSPEAFSVLIGSALGGKLPDLSGVPEDDQRPAIRAFLGELSFDEAGAVVRATSDLFAPLDPAQA